MTFTESKLKQLADEARYVATAIRREEDTRHAAGRDRLFPPTVEKAANRLAEDLDSAYLDVVATGLGSQV